MLSTEEIKGVDLAQDRRPGYQASRPIGPWPNTRYPPTPQQGTPAVPTHGRPGKTTPPVFSTALPPRGVSGAIRKLAYRTPDHQVRHWLLLLFADRVEATGPRLRRLSKVGLPVAALGVLALPFFAMTKR